MIRTVTQKMSLQRVAAYAVAVAACIVLCAQPLAAQCGPALQCIVQHSQFRGTHWNRRLAEHSIVVDDSVCSLGLVDITVAGSDTANYAVGAAPDGSFHLVKVVWRRQQFFCALPRYVVEEPVALGLSPAPGTACWRCIARTSDPRR